MSLTEYQVTLAANVGFDFESTTPMDQAQEELIEYYVLELEDGDLLDPHDIRVLTAFNISPKTFEKLK